MVTNKERQNRDIYKNGRLRLRQRKGRQPKKREGVRSRGIYGKAAVENKVHRTERWVKKKDRENT